MTVAALNLVKPESVKRDELLSFIDEFVEAGEPFWQSRRDQVANDFASFLREWRQRPLRHTASGENVPDSQYFLMQGDRILGSCRIRHWLTPALREEGGHIGYDVRPSERGKGYATAMLGMALEICRGMGLQRVMVTCDKDNVASARVIQKNAGVLESEGRVGPRGKIVQRYWITL